MTLGNTQIDERTFDEFLVQTRRLYTKDNYHLLGTPLFGVSIEAFLITHTSLGFNCITFANLCAAFLTGQPIPEKIQSERQLAVQT